MSRPWPLAFLLLSGCSNAPIAGTMDCLFPSRMKPAPVVPDLGRERDRDLEPIRPIDRVPTDDPLRPLDPPRPGRDGGARLGDPISRELGREPGREYNPRPRRTAPEPRSGNDSELPLLTAPGGGGGLSDPLPPPPGVR